MFERAELLFLTPIVVGILLVLVLHLARWPDRKFPLRPWQRVSIAGLVIGGITPICAPIILAIPLVIYFEIAPPKEGSSGPNGWLYWLLYSTIGLGRFAFGGYVAARIAKHDELLNGLLSSFLCTAISIYSILLGKDPQSLFAQIFFLAAAPAFALFGGYLRHRQKRIGRTPGTVGAPCA
jgi:hypothetical protein